MRFLAVVAVVGAGLVAWTWGTAGEDAPAAWHVERRVAEHVPALLARQALRAARPVVGSASACAEARVVAVADRLLVLWAAAPVVLLLLSTGVVAGLVVRESARDALRFSSPTWNFVGKRLAAVALVAALVLPLLPWSVPPGAWYGSVLLVSLGVGLYVANLPVKL